jgi:hypothetical protein
LRIGRPELLLLGGSEVLPCFHASQDTLLAFRRQAIKVLQALLELLLPLPRQSAKCGVGFERAPLLIEWLFAMPVQPLPGMVALHRRLVWAGNLIRSLRRGLVVLRR